MITTIFAWWVVVSFGFAVGYASVVTLWRGSPAMPVVPCEPGLIARDAELDELEAWWARCEGEWRVS